MVTTLVTTIMTIICDDGDGWLLVVNCGLLKVMVEVDGNYIGDYNNDYNMWSMVMVNVNDSVHECILSFVILTQQPSENI